MCVYIVLFLLSWCKLFRLVSGTDESTNDCLEDKSKEDFYFTKCIAFVVAPFDVGNFIVNQIIKGEKK